MQTMFLTSAVSFQWNRVEDDKIQCVTSHWALIAQDRLDTTRAAISA